ncbi:unnamed protein product [Medioppia subpectinata]|uniref:C2H2-type domain-containing protein n=1 Tax=Medioppia subpectinata TaxID=1979941 RepID=A0A7R9KNS8_9ACAR|nr:unnamed protein product [Medioppia subpectinata]CAG2107009.1 unnamed protein product [Medioppia subpectinata]
MSDETYGSVGHHIKTEFEDRLKSPSNDRQMRPTDETLEVNQNIDDNSDGVNEDMFDNLYDSNGLELGSVIKEVSEDSCVEPMNKKIQTQINAYLKPSIPQSSQEMVNNDMIEKSSEDSMEMPSKQLMTDLLIQNKIKRFKCFDLSKDAFICPINKCHKSCKTDHNFAVHLKNIHTSRQYVCTHEGCGKGYKLNRQLKDHLLTHNTSKSFRCPHNGCEFKTVSNKRFRDHSRKHSKFLPKILPKVSLKRVLFTCDVGDCRQTFISPDGLKSHTLSHQSDPSGDDVSIDAEMTSNELMAKILTQNKFERKKCFDRTLNAFVCPINKCHKRYPMDRPFTIHLQRSHSLKQFQCTHEGCDRAYKTKSHLSEHLETHNTIKAFRCPHNGCDHKAVCRKNLRDHMRHKHSKGIIKAVKREPMKKSLKKSERLKCFSFTTNTFNCPVNECRESYPTSGQFRDHLKTIHAKNLYICKSKDCYKAFNTINGLARHSLIHRTSGLKEIVNSSEESMEMRSMSEFLRQNKSERKKCFDFNTNAFICPINKCHKSCGTDDKFYRHLAAVHSKRQYYCHYEDCGKAFTLKGNLTIHWISHNKIKSFQCPHNWCQYNTSSDRNLKLHLKRHPKQPFRCPRNGCQYKCVNNKLLTSHLKRHLTDTTDRVIRCPVSDCKVEFKSKNELNVHRLTHGSGPAINCGTKGCNEMFYTFSQRLRHRVSVHNRRTYSYRRGKQWFEWKGKTETQEVMQTIDDNNEGVNEDIFDNSYDSNGLKLRTNIKEEPEIYFVEQINIQNSLMSTGMQTQLIATSKPSTSLSSQRVVNKDMSGRTRQSVTTNMTPKTSLAELLIQNRSERLKYFSFTTNTFNCPVNECRESYPTSGQFRDHLKTIHTKNKYVCKYNDCYKAFNTNNGLARHSLTHKTSQPKGMTNNDIIENNSEDSMKIPSNETVSQFLIQNKTEREKCFELSTNTFICPINDCHKSYQNDRTFLQHLRKTHVLRQYVCTHEGCGKGFKTKHTLSSHQLTHKPFEPFHCPYNGCLYKAVTNRGFEQHMRHKNTSYHSTDASTRPLTIFVIHLVANTQWETLTAICQTIHNLKLVNLNVCTIIAMASGHGPSAPVGRVGSMAKNDLILNLFLTRQL